MSILAAHHGALKRGGALLFEDFEAGNVFSFGPMTVARSADAAKNGDYGLRRSGSDGHLGLASDVGPLSKFRLTGWVRLAGGYPIAGLGASPTQIPTANGYQLYLDARNYYTQPSNAQLQLRKNASTSSVLSYSTAVVITANTWYLLSLSFNGDAGIISGVVFDDELTELMSVSASDNIYSSCWPTLASFSLGDWDDILIEGL